MPLVAIEAIIKIVMYILEWIITKKSNNDKLKEAFAQFAELARTENIKTINERKKSEEQIDKGNAAWDKIDIEK
jgi:hypothetical protein